MGIRHLYFKAVSTELSRCVVITDCLAPDNPVVFANAAFQVFSGYTQSELVGRNLRMLQGPETNPETVRELREAIAAGRSIRREILNYRKDGTTYWSDVTIDPIRDKTGRIIGHVGLQHDPSDKLTAIEERSKAERQLASIVEKMPGFLFTLKLDAGKPDAGTPENGRRVVSAFLSGAAAPATVNARGAPVHLTDRLSAEDAAILWRQAAEAAQGVTSFAAEFRMTDADGPARWFRCTSSIRAQEDGLAIWEGLAVEISGEKAQEAKLAYLTYHDAVTGVSNRAHFSRALQAALTSIGSDSVHIGLLHVDLDDFQGVNDRAGLAFGDAFLREAGHRLSALLAHHDCLVARLGGDEFAVLLPALPTEAQVTDVAQAICRELGRPFEHGGARASTTASVGAAVFPRLSDASQIAAGEEWAAELMKRAFVALQSAQLEGPGTIRLYSADIDDRHRNRVTLRQTFKQAVAEARQFRVHYQPLVELDTGRIVGAEGLLRWDHPELGLQRPDLFIPMAESSGLIVPLGRLVLRSVMAQAQTWRKAGLHVPRLAINVSSVQLRNGEFVAMVEDALREFEGDPRDFEFELTEGMVVEARTTVRDQLHALRDMGFGLAIDDFGTGHSTFSYLREFPVDKLKIDQTFVRQLVLNSNDASIIRAMVALSRSLELAVVAEGIETAMQREFLRAEGCLVGQGYLFSPPVPAEEMGALLQARSTLPGRAAASAPEPLRAAG